jgi:tRNA-specific 2-thiouridylase
VRTEPETNTIVVGPRASLARSTVGVAGRLYVPVARADVKLRYRSPATPARIRPGDDGFEVELETPAYGVAAGQAAVVYEEDAVVGAGLVRRGA